MKCLRRRRDDEATYVSGVYLPSGPWERAQPAARRRVHLDLVPLQPSLFASFYRLWRDLGPCSVDEYEQRFNGEIAQELCGAVGRALSDEGHALELSAPIVAVTHRHVLPDATPIQLASTTVDPDGLDGLRGLHVDNWQQPMIPLLERDSADIKVLVNLGLKARRFSFVPHSIASLAEWARTVEGAEPALAHDPFASPLAEWFLETVSPPVLAVEMPPRHALLAPVQNLVHDGLPGDRSALDICLQVRGSRA